MKGLLTPVVAYQTQSGIPRTIRTSRSFSSNYAEVFQFEQSLWQTCDNNYRSPQKSLLVKRFWLGPLPNCSYFFWVRSNSIVFNYMAEVNNLFLGKPTLLRFSLQIRDTKKYLEEVSVLDCSKWSASVKLSVSTSSTMIYTILKICSQDAPFIKRRKVPGALERPNGMRTYSYSPPSGIRKPVFWRCSGATGIRQYPPTKSREEKMCAPLKASNIWSIFEMGNASFIVTSLSFR